MKFGVGVDYSLKALLLLAERYPTTSPVRVEEIAATQDIPENYLRRLLIELKRGGLVASQKGPSGGYMLARAPSAITLGQVARAVDGEVFEDVCAKYDRGSKDCRHQDGCNISPVWQKLGALVTGYFESVTLAAILEQKPADCGAAPAWLEKLAGG